MSVEAVSTMSLAHKSSGHLVVFPPLPAGASVKNRYSHSASATQSASHVRRNTSRSADCLGAEPMAMNTLHAGWPPPRRAESGRAFGPCCLAMGLRGESLSGRCLATVGRCLATGRRAELSGRCLATGRAKSSKSTGRCLAIARAESSGGCLAMGRSSSERCLATRRAKPSGRWRASSYGLCLATGRAESSLERCLVSVRGES